MNSIGSAHADRSCALRVSHVSTPDRMLFIIGRREALVTGLDEAMIGQKTSHSLIFTRG